MSNLSPSPRQRSDTKNPSLPRNAHSSMFVLAPKGARSAVASVAASSPAKPNSSPSPIRQIFLNNESIKSETSILSSSATETKDSFNTFEASSSPTDKRSSGGAAKGLANVMYSVTSAPPPSWLLDLRVLWGQEISSMDQDKQEWFLKQQEEVFATKPDPNKSSRRVSYSLSSSESKFTSSAENSTVDDLEPWDDPSDIGDTPESMLEDLYRHYGAPPPPMEDPPEPASDSSPQSQSTIFPGIFRWLTGASSEADVEQLKKYSSRLRAMIGVKERRILDLNKRKQRTRAKATEEVEKYSRWAADHLANVARSYYENRILWFSTQLEIEVYYVRAWTSVADLIDTYIYKRDSSSRKNIATLIYTEVDDKVVFRDPLDLQLPPKYENLKKSMVNMESVLNALRADFKEARRAESLKAQKSPDRAQKIKFLLRKGAIDSIKDSFEGTYFHHVDRVSQHEFNRLMIDERHQEGLTLVKWKDLLSANSKNLTPQWIVKGIFQFMKNVVVGNDLSPNENLLKLDVLAPPSSPSHSKHANETSGGLFRTSIAAASPYSEPPTSNLSSTNAEFDPDLVITIWTVLKLYVDRLIYPRFNNIISNFTDAADIEKDKIFARKCRWLNRLTQEDFKIHPQLRCNIAASSINSESHLKPNTLSRSLSEAGTSTAIVSKSKTVSSANLKLLPYHKAIGHLSRLEADCEMVPINVLGHCVLFGKLIEEQAREYIVDKKFVYAADDLVPVVEWCLVHSKVNRIHEIIAHTHRFLGNDASTGQGGYYLSSIEVALNALMLRTPDEFGLDVDESSLGDADSKIPE